MANPTTLVSQFACFPALRFQQRAIVTAWAAWLSANDANGIVGEIGWPNTVYPNFIGVDHASEAAAWNSVGEGVYQAFDTAGIGAMYFMAGARHLENHNLAVWHNAVDEGPIDTAEPSATVVQAHPQTENYLRGVNVNAWDFSGGVPDMPTVADLAYLAAQGVQTIRVHHGITALLTAPGSSLDSGYEALLDQLVADCAAVGLGLILLTNWDAGWNGDYLHQSAGDWTQADLIDLWRRLSDKYKSNATVVAYAIGNEPHDMVSLPGAGFVVGDNEWTFDADVDTWNHDYWPVISTWDAVHGSASPGCISQQFTTSFGTGFAYIDGKISGGLALSPTSDEIAQAMVWLDPGAGSGWQAQIQLVQTYTVLDSGPMFDLVPGEWVPISAQLADMGGTADQWLRIFWQNVMAPAGTWELRFDDIGTGGFATPPKSPAEHWESISQAVVTDLRTTKADTKPIIVPGYGWTLMDQFPTNHPDAWIIDPNDATTYDCHLYFDNSGAYPELFPFYDDAAIADDVAYVDVDTLLAYQDRQGSGAWAPGSDTRYADLATNLLLDNPNSGPFTIDPTGRISPLSGSVAFRFTRLIDTGSEETILTCGTVGAATDYLELGIDASDHVYMEWNSNGAGAQRVTGTDAIAVDTEYFLYFDWSGTAIRLSVENGTLATGTRDAVEGDWGAGELVLGPS